MFDDRHPEHVCVESEIVISVAIEGDIDDSAASNIKQTRVLPTRTPKDRFLIKFYM